MGAEVLYFPIRELVIVLIMFNKYLHAWAVANLIAEIDICLCYFLWVRSRAGCLGMGAKVLHFPLGN